MSNEPKIGQLLPNKHADRDAIHIAIAPVVAAEGLRPGQHVGFVQDGNTELVGPNTKALIGIVDPYLDEVVHEGSACWLFLYPQTITSLRHNWTHPAFAKQEPDQRVKNSERWLRDFLRDNGPRYDDLIEAVKGDGSVMDDDGYNGIRIDGDYLTVFGTDAYGEIPDEFWDHVEVVTGKTIKERPEHFSCSC